MIKAEKPLNLILKKDFAEQILRGEKKYEFRSLGSNMASKLFKGGLDLDHYVKYDKIRFQIGYTKKYFIIECVGQLLANYIAIGGDENSPSMPERAIWDEDAKLNPEKYEGETTLLDIMDGFCDYGLEHYTQEEKEENFICVFKLGKVVEDCSGL